VKKRERQKVEIEKNLLDRMVEALVIVAIIFQWIYVSMHFGSLPDVIPVHFDARGDADGFGKKAMIWMLPAISTLLCTGLLALTRIPHLLNYPAKITEENAGKQYKLAGQLLRYMALSLVTVFLLILLTSIQMAEAGTGKEKAWLFPVILAIIFVPTIYFIIQMVKNR